MRTALVTSVLAFLVACGGPAPQDAPDAVVSDAPTVETTKVASELAGAPIDLAQSRLVFIPSKVVGSHPTVINQYKGAVAVTDGKVTSIQYKADMDSMESDHPRLTKHLKDADFFDVAKYPHSTFTSSAVAEGSDVDGFTHTVTGDMTIVGKTKRISFPANITIEGGQVKANTQFDIDRRDFGLLYPGMKDNLVQDIVNMEITLVAPLGSS